MQVGGAECECHRHSSLDVTSTSLDAHTLGDPPGSTIGFSKGCGKFFQVRRRLECTGTLFLAWQCGEMLERRRNACAFALLQNVSRQRFFRRRHLPLLVRFFCGGRRSSDGPAMLDLTTHDREQRRLVTPIRRSFEPLWRDVCWWYQRYKPPVASTIRAPVAPAR